jgi:hypothetical protein
MATKYYANPKRARKTVYIGILLEPYHPRECTFRGLDRAIEWCLTNSQKTGYSSEVVHGVSSGGKVVWKHKGSLPKKPAARQKASNNRRWSGPATRVSGDR